MLSFFIDVTDNSLSYDFLKKILLDIFFSFIFTPHLQIFWEDMIFCIYLGGGVWYFQFGFMVANCTVLKRFRNSYTHI